MVGDEFPNAAEGRCRDIKPFLQKVCVAYGVSYRALSSNKHRKGTGTWPPPSEDSASRRRDVEAESFVTRFCRRIMLRSEKKS